MIPKIVTPKVNTDGSSKAKVLFVDDEERILNTMRALFRSKYDVVVTTDGNEALALLKKEHYDLIVSDQRMPIMKGVDLLRQAKTISPNTVRVLLTGFSDLADLMGSINEGEIFRFVSKPWDNTELAQIVEDGVQIGIALAADSFTASQQVPAYQPTVTREGVIIINGDAAMHGLVSGLLPHCEVHSAKNHAQALAIMGEHLIAVVVSSMDGDHKADTAFFTMLKREQPQITSIILAPSGDSEALVNLINQARVFRYMFKPLKQGLFNTYLNSALKEYSSFKNKPKLLLSQKPKASVAPQVVSPTLLATLRGLKSFFSRGEK
jgi:eukaryotic-like serine/threonine-protein kinase